MTVPPGRRPSLVVDVAHPRVHGCGGDSWLLSPRRWDEARRRFDPVAIAPSEPDALPLLPEEEPFLVDHVLGDARFTHVSSHARSPLPVSYQVLDDSLMDRNPGTGWLAGGAGNGHGEFLVGTVQPEVAVTGITLLVPRRPEVTPPSALLLRTSQGRVWRLEGVEAGTLMSWTLPEPDPGPCVALALIGDHAQPGRPLGLAIAQLHTTLDQRSLSAALDDVLLPRLQEVWLGVDQRRVISMVASMGVPALDPLLERFERFEGEAQASLIPVLLSIEGGRERLLQALQHTPLSTASARELSRRGVLDEPGSTSVIVARLLQANTEATLQDQLRMLARSASPSIAPVGLSYLQSQDEVTRTLAHRVVQRISPDATSEVLSLAMELTPALKAHVLTALVASIRHSQRSDIQLGPGDRDRVRALLQDDDSVVVRRVLRLLAQVQDGELLADVEMMALTDPHPRLRAEAIDALARYRREVWDARIALTLSEAASDESPVVRLHAARALTHAPFAREAIEALLMRWEVETWPDTRRSLLQALLAIRSDDIDRRVSEDLAALSPPEALAALRAFQNRGRPLSRSAIEATDAAFPDHPEVRVALIQTVASRGSSDADAWLVDRLDRADSIRVRAALLEALGRRNLSEAREALHSALLDPEPAIRRAAVRGLATDRSPATRTLLEAHARQETSNEVRATIERILEAQAAGSRVDELWMETREQLEP